MVNERAARKAALVADGWPGAIADKIVSISDRSITDSILYNVDTYLQEADRPDAVAPTLELLAEATQQDWLAVEDGKGEWWGFDSASEDMKAYRAQRGKLQRAALKLGVVHESGDADRGLSNEAFTVGGVDYAWSCDYYGYGSD